jgi:uncharacterized cupin superfamily protein
MSRQIVNIADIELQPRPPAYAPTGAAAERYDAQVGMIGPRIGARLLGYNITSVAPGKRAYPFHNHLANEEMFFVLSGTGEIRIGDEVHPIRQGDFIACPPGGADTAHQIINSGSEELRYLALSTRQSPEIAEYPDTGAFGVIAVRPSEADGKPRGMLMHIGREGEGLDYWSNT